MGRNQQKILAIISTLIILGAFNSALAVESKNYKISEEEFEFGNPQGQVDAYKTNKIDNSFKGVASAGKITRRSVNIKIFLPILFVLLVCIFFFFDKFRKKDFLGAKKY